jgi:germination protein M
MKKFLCLILLFSMLLWVAGCSEDAPEPEGVPFYYCILQPDYAPENAILSPEYRKEIAVGSLEEQLALYLQGPISAELRSPFPEGSRLVGISQENGTVYVTLSPEITLLTGVDLTMACGCLTLTILSLTEAQQVQIRSVSGLLDGQRSITMDKNTLLLLDGAGKGE